MDHMLCMLNRRSLEYASPSCWEGAMYKTARSISVHNKPLKRLELVEPSCSVAPDEF